MATQPTLADVSAKGQGVSVTYHYDPTGDDRDPEAFLVYMVTVVQEAAQMVIKAVEKYAASEYASLSHSEQVLTYNLWQYRIRQSK